MESPCSHRIIFRNSKKFSKLDNESLGNLRFESRNSLYLVSVYIYARKGGIDGFRIYSEHRQMEVSTRGTFLDRLGLGPNLRQVIVDACQKIYDLIFEKFIHRTIPFLCLACRHAW